MSMCVYKTKSLSCTPENNTVNQPSVKVNVLAAQSSPTLCDPVDCSPSGSSSVHGILQARILEWVSRGSSRPRDQTQAICTEGRFLTIWAATEAQSYFSLKKDQYLDIFWSKPSTRSWSKPPCHPRNFQLVIRFSRTCFLTCPNSTFHTQVPNSNIYTIHQNRLFLWKDNKF